MTVLESIRTYILTIPFLKDGKIGIDYLGVEAGDYSINDVPTEIVIKKYLDGSSLRAKAFTFTSKEMYSVEYLNNLSNSGFYEDFANWLEEQTYLGNLPTMATGLQAESIQALSNGYLFDVDTTGDKAQYQIQCQLVYFKEKPEPPVVSI
jgi:hypothetical protein